MICGLGFFNFHANVVNVACFVVVVVAAAMTLKFPTANLCAKYTSDKIKERNRI